MYLSILTYTHLYLSIAIYGAQYHGTVYFKPFALLLLHILSRIPSSLSPKRECRPKGVKAVSKIWLMPRTVFNAFTRPFVSGGYSVTATAVAPKTRQYVSQSEVSGPWRELWHYSMRNGVICNSTLYLVYDSWYQVPVALNGLVG
ncbi:unnamed protein product [Laminaria digitata]